MESPKICYECKWCDCRRDDVPAPREAACRHPNAERFRDVVSGAWPLCRDMRNYSDTLCSAALAGYPDAKAMKAEEEKKCFGKWYEPADVRSQDEQA